MSFAIERAALEFAEASQTVTDRLKSNWGERVEAGYEGGREKSF